MSVVTTDPFVGYATAEDIFDEMLDSRAQPRRSYKRLHKELLKLTPEELSRSKQKADLSFFNQGITFTVYGRSEGTERIFPHDLLPRIITSAEWEGGRAEFTADPVSAETGSRISLEITIQ